MQLIIVYCFMRNCKKNQVTSTQEVKEKAQNQEKKSRTDCTQHFEVNRIFHTISCFVAWIEIVDITNVMTPFGKSLYFFSYKRKSCLLENHSNWSNQYINIFLLLASYDAKWAFCKLSTKTCKLLFHFLSLSITNNNEYNQ